MSYRALNYIELVLKFAFSVEIFVVLFSFVGFLMLVTSFFAWLVNRLTTHLLNPPDLKIWSLLALTAPPPAAGVALALIPIWIYLQMGNLLIYGVFYYDPNAANTIPYGFSIMEIANNGSRFNLQYANLLNVVPLSEMVLARSGRTGSVFCIVGFACLFAGNKFYFPKKESKKELELAKTLNKLARKKDLWQPVFWRKQNFMLSSFLCALLCILLIEFSYSTQFTQNQFQARIVLYIMGKVLDRVIRYQLQDHILCMPISNAFGFTAYLIIFNSQNFIEFLLASFFLFGLSLLNRVYMDGIFHLIVTSTRALLRATITFTIRITPRLLKPIVIYMFEATEKDDKISKEKRIFDGILRFF